MEKRTLLAVVLSLAVLILWNIAFPPPKPAPKPAQPETAISTPVSAEHSVAERPSATTDVAEMSAGDVPVSATSQAIPERLIEVQTTEFSAVLSSKGGRIISWILNDYRDKAGKTIQMIPSEGVIFTIGDIQVGDETTLNSLIFATEEPQEALILSEDLPKHAIAFQLVTEKGLEITKTYTFYQKLMLVDLEITARNVGQGTLDGTISMFLPDKILDGAALNGQSSYVRSGPMLMQNGKRDQPKSSKFSSRWIYPDPVQWVAYTENYFFAGMVPTLGTNRAFFEPTSYNQNNTKALTGTLGLQAGSGPISSGEKVRAAASIIVGPKKYEQLKELNVGIENIIDFGWITWLGKAFYYILVSTVKFVKNYGLAIILLTVAIKIILWPLSHISMKSMKKMQEIQPQVKDLQARFKKEPQKLQAELSLLYRKHGVNPMSGCLPMLIQIPVFIALYQVLIASFEMRGASFLWVGDLAQRDIPLVIIMGVTMLIQQKMTPASGDPTQARMMMLMPIVFTVMFMSAPSGLVLYWLMNNVLTIVQQYFMNPKKNDAEAAPKLKARTLKKIAEQTDSSDK